jgi:hypothetical protein
VSQNINVLLYHGKSKESVASAQSPLRTLSSSPRTIEVAANECAPQWSPDGEGTTDAPIDLASDDESEALLHPFHCVCIQKIGVIMHGVGQPLQTGSQVVSRKALH